MAKELTFGNDVRSKLAAGVDKVARAVCATLGPGGKFVFIETGWGSPNVTKDGVTVAKEVVPLEDPVENLGAMLLKEAATKTNDVAGDGTTTATLLAQSMYTRGLKTIEGDKKPNPIYLRRGIESAVKFVVEGLETLTKEVKKDELYNVALISSNHNEELAGIIDLAINGGTIKPKDDEGEPVAYEGVGPHGMITVKEGRTHETTVEFVEGYEFDRGYKAPIFITDQERMVAEIEKPYVVLYDGKLNSPEILVKLLDAIPEGERNVVFIADDFSQDVLATLYLNGVRGAVQPAAVIAPGFGDRRKEMLDDIAIVTGGEVISAERGHSIDKMSKENILAMCGKAKHVRVDKDKTTLIDSAGDRAAIDKRVKMLEGQMKKSTSDYESEKMEERIARLAGKVAVIYVGAFTESEVKPKKYSIDDALNAVRAASAEGIVPGGGVAYLRLGQMLEAYIKKQKGLNADAKLGMGIVAEALREPLYKIAENAGADAGEVLEKVSANENPSFGYDALNHEYQDMFDKKVGIVDPALVVRSAIVNAASVVMSLLNAECAVTIIPEKDGGAGPAMPHM